MEREISSIEKKHTWKEIEKPNDAEILKTKWVYAKKPLEPNEEDKYKASLIVKGCG